MNGLSSRNEPEPTDAGGVWSRFLAHRRAAELLVFIAPLLLFARTVSFDYTGWDDTGFVIQNLMVVVPGSEWIVKALTKPNHGYYAPTLWLAFRAQYAIWGPFPAGYHAFNALLHAINAWLVFRLCLKIGVARGGALVGALLWAVHPLRVESVAWIAELKDVLSAFFCLLSALVYLNSRARSAGLISMFRAPRYWLSVMLFVLALGAKATVCPWPLMIVLIDAFRAVFPPDNGGVNAKAPSPVGAWFPRFAREIRVGIAAILPMLIASTFFGVAMFRAQSASGVIDRKFTGTLPPKILLPAFSVSFHSLKMICPMNLSGVYNVPEPVRLWRELPPGEKGGAFGRGIYALSLLGAICFAAAGIASLRRAPWVSCCMAFFIVGLSPMIQIIPTARPFADRYTYLPGIAVSVLAGCALVRLSSWSATRKHPLAVFGLLSPGILIGILFIASLERQIVWRDALTFWNDVVKHDPRGQVTFGNLGVAHLLRGEFEEARDAFQEATAFSLKRDKPYTQTAMALLAMGRRAEALAKLEEMAVVCREEGEDPATGVRKLIDACMGLGMHAEAAQVLERLSGMGDDAARAALLPRLADALRLSGQSDRAIELLNDHLKRHPDDAGASRQLALCLLRAKRFDEARAAFMKWEKLGAKPDEVRAWLAEVVLKSGDANGAIAICREGLKNNPGSPFLLGAMARGCLMLAEHAPGSPASRDLNDQAEDYAARAWAIDPGNFEYDMTRARALARKGQVRRAYWTLAKYETLCVNVPEMAFRFSQILGMMKGRDAQSQTYLRAALNAAPRDEDWLPEAINGLR
ncbi:MAG TPA: tetratricopeptide repeat protein [Candidatus Brocadiia bacterium]|nr:tetratricopeptide repeat protein [Candidatus Brocadiia bacterium]